MTLTRPLDTGEDLIERADVDGRMVWWGTRVVAAAVAVALVLGLILAVVALNTRGQAEQMRQELDGQRLSHYTQPHR